MKNNTVTVAKVIDDFIEEFPYGYWEGVCSCCTGFDSTEEALKAHLQKFFTTLTQHHQDELREERERIIAIIDNIDAPEGAWREALTGFKKVITTTIELTADQSELDQPTYL